MEPVIVTVEECNRFFIVQQRWGHDNGKSMSDSWPREDATHGVTFQTAYIFTPMQGPYARVYREWCNYDSRSRQSQSFGYIVEAKNKRQVAEEMVRRGHHAMFNNKMLHPHDCEHQIEVVEMVRFISEDPCCGQCGAYPCQREARCFGLASGGPIKANSSAAALESMQMRLLRQASDLQDKIDHLNSLPDEPEADGDKPLVIYFQKQFHDGGKFFDYAAIKVGGLWYTTGPRSPKGYTWQQLIEWIDEGHWPVLRRAAKFKEL